MVHHDGLSQSFIIFEKQGAPILIFVFVGSGLQWCFQATIQRRKGVVVTNLPFHLDLTPSQGY
jgi:hypothetical protein